MATVETTFAPDEGQHATVTVPNKADGTPVSFPGAFTWASDAPVATATNISGSGTEADLIGNKTDEGSATVTVSNTDSDGAAWAGMVKITVKKSAVPVVGDLVVTLGPVFKLPV